MSAQPVDHFADAILSALCRIEGKLDSILHQMTPPPNEETTHL